MLYGIGDFADRDKICLLPQGHREPEGLVGEVLFVAGLGPTS
ncbi:MAG: hypothetical protein ACLVKI_13820 [Gordonibacter urolithinfaciens]